MLSHFEKCTDLAPRSRRKSHQYEKRKQIKCRERERETRNDAIFNAAKMNCLQNFNMPFIDSMNINCANNAYSTPGTITNDHARDRVADTIAVVVPWMFA